MKTRLYNIKNLIPIFIFTFSLLISSSINYNNIFAKEDLNFIVGSGLIVGTNKDDVIKADETEDDENDNPISHEIFGDAGNDYIKGGPNDDFIFGGSGNDRIHGDSDDADEEGSDVIFGGNGDDTILGEAGDDLLYGERGDDNLIGGDDIDILDGGNGNDHLYGNDADDILKGGKGSDYFNCGAGIDTVIDYDISENDVATADCEIGISSSRIPNYD